MGAAALVPYVVAALGATASYVNTRNTERKQNDVLMQQLASERSHQQDVDAQTKQLLDKRAQSTPDAEHADILNKFHAALAANQAQAVGATQQVGNVSDAYKKSGADAALGITDYGASVANLLSNMDAPHYQRQDESAQDSRYQSAVGQVGNFNSGDDSVYRMRLANIHRNPWLDMLAAGAQAYAGATAGGMGGAGGGSFSPGYNGGGGGVISDGYGWTPFGGYVTPSRSSAWGGG